MSVRSGRSGDGSSVSVSLNCTGVADIDPKYLSELFADEPKKLFRFMEKKYKRYDACLAYYDVNEINTIDNVVFKTDEILCVLEAITCMKKYLFSASVIGADEFDDKIAEVSVKFDKLSDKYYEALIEFKKKADLLGVSVLITDELEEQLRSSPSKLVEFLWAKYTSYVAVFSFYDAAKAETIGNLSYKIDLILDNLIDISSIRRYLDSVAGFIPVDQLNRAAIKFCLLSDDYYDRLQEFNIKLDLLRTSLMSNEDTDDIEAPVSAIYAPGDGIAVAVAACNEANSVSANEIIGDVITPYDGVFSKYDAPVVEAEKVIYAANQHEALGNKKYYHNEEICKFSVTQSNTEVIDSPRDDTLKNEEIIIYYGVESETMKNSSQFEIKRDYAHVLKSDHRVNDQVIAKVGPEIKPQELASISIADPTASIEQYPVEEHEEVPVCFQDDCGTDGFSETNMYNKINRTSIKESYSAGHNICIDNPVNQTDKSSGYCLVECTEECTDFCKVNTEGAKKCAKKCLVECTEECTDFCKENTEGAKKCTKKCLVNCTKGSTENECTKESTENECTKESTENCSKDRTSIDTSIVKDNSTEECTIDCTSYCTKESTENCFKDRTSIDTSIVKDNSTEECTIDCTSYCTKESTKERLKVYCTKESTIERLEDKCTKDSTENCLQESTRECTKDSTGECTKCSTRECTKDSSAKVSTNSCTNKCTVCKCTKECTNVSTNKGTQESTKDYTKESICKDTKVIMNKCTEKSTGECTKYSTNSTSESAIGSTYECTKKGIGDHFNDGTNSCTQRECTKDCTHESTKDCTKGSTEETCTIENTDKCASEFTEESNSKYTKESIVYECTKDSANECAEYSAYEYTKVCTKESTKQCTRNCFDESTNDCTNEYKHDCTTESANDCFVCTNVGTKEYNKDFSKSTENCTTNSSADCTRRKTQDCTKDCTRDCTKDCTKDHTKDCMKVSIESFIIESTEVCTSDRTDEINNKTDNETEVAGNIVTDEPSGNDTNVSSECKFIFQDEVESEAQERADFVAQNRAEFDAHHIADVAAHERTVCEAQVGADFVANYCADFVAHNRHADLLTFDRADFLDRCRADFLAHCRADSTTKSRNDVTVDLTAVITADVEVSSSVENKDDFTSSRSESAVKENGIVSTQTEHVTVHEADLICNAADIFELNIARIEFDAAVETIAYANCYDEVAALLNIVSKEDSVLVTDMNSVMKIQMNVILPKPEPTDTPPPCLSNALS